VRLRGLLSAVLQHAIGKATFGLRCVTEKVTLAARADAIAKTRCGGCGTIDPGKPTASIKCSAVTSVLRHCWRIRALQRVHRAVGTLLAQNAEQPELARADLVEALPADLRSGFRCCDQAVSPLTRKLQAIAACEATSDERSAGICMLTFCGSRERANRPGHRGRSAISSYRDQY